MRLTASTLKVMESIAIAEELQQLQERNAGNLVAKGISTTPPTLMAGAVGQDGGMARVRAPELRGRGWLNTGGEPLTIQGLRGKIVLLDFWTSCCINCLHVLDELRAIEEKYADVLVVVGVHSPKFEHEKDAVALAAAVERYGVSHPVLDDPQLQTWDAYAARAWPTLAVIDPNGYVVATMAGEGHASGIAALVDELIAKHDADGSLRRGDGPYVPPEPPSTDLRYPGKAVALPDGTLLVSSSAQHALVQLEADAEAVRRRIGAGTRGRADGPSDQAQFSEPQGMVLLPAAVATAVGYDMVVADTVNHLLRGVRLADGRVSTVAGTGRQERTPAAPGTHDALDVDLSSPWDLAWFEEAGSPDRVIIAMAGNHQLWWFDPVAAQAGIYAGTTVEALKDGPLAEVWMAQPSGLSVSRARLWVADSESSAIRFVEGGQMHTVAGQGLFDFGLVDGPADSALFQHPLGVCALPDGGVLVADTYNGAVRLISRPAGGPNGAGPDGGGPDGGGRIVSTIATGLAEPSDIVATPDGGAIVVESAAHRLTRIAPSALAAAGTDGARTDGVRMRTQRRATTLQPGPVTLDVLFTPPPGQKLDESFGPAIRVTVSASPPELLASGAGVSSDLTRSLVVAPDVAGGVLQVVAQAATCDADAEFPACHLTRQDWGVPITVDPDGSTRVSLTLHEAEIP